MMDSPDLDVTIIGGGPAGLSAALLLGRCLRKVLICDARRPRNERSGAMHAYLGLDGINPGKFLEQARCQLERYESVAWKHTTVITAEKNRGTFVCVDETGAVHRSKALLVATGLIDSLPDVPGIVDYYGVSVHHCPFCDGWENRGKRIGVIGSDRDAVKLAIELRRWSETIFFFTQGGPAVFPAATGIEVFEGTIASLDGARRRLSGVVLDDGRRIPMDALFFSPHQAQHPPIAASLGCVSQGGMIPNKVDCSTGVAGLYAAGNATMGVQLAIVAAAEGVKAGAAINDWLTEQGYP